MEKEEQIKTFAKALKHQVGLALSENECYQLIKLVWNTAEKEALKPDSLQKTLQIFRDADVKRCQPIQYKPQSRV